MRLEWCCVVQCRGNRSMYHRGWYDVSDLSQVLRFTAKRIISCLCCLLMKTLCLCGVVSTKRKVMDLQIVHSLLEEGASLDERDLER
jgi:hypothetical protein